MSVNRFFPVCLLILLLVFGCSKKQEEAAQLEQELAGGQDTLAEMVDTAAEVTPPAAEVEAVPEEPEMSSMGRVPGSGYTVQVAGCEDREYAELLIRKYTNRGYEPYMVSASVEGQTYYRVRIGSFETLTEAKALRDQLIDRYSIEPWIDYIQ